jgi:hypothetical protein
MSTHRGFPPENPKLFRSAMDWLTVGLILFSVLITIVMASWALDSAASMVLIAPDFGP